MSTLVTPQQVIDLAFVPEGVMTATKITAMDITIAESRYLIPILGQELYDTLLANRYTELRDNYVTPMVAAWTRYIAEPLMAERLGAGYDNDYNQADNDARYAILVRLRHNASALSRRLSDYLNSHSAEFAEYDPANNPLNHCTIDGGIVQIF
jgi:hypothetical protein